MAEKGREGYFQEQDCLSYRFQVTITNSPDARYKYIPVAVRSRIAQPQSAQHKVEMNSEHVIAATFSLHDALRYNSSLLHHTRLTSIEKFELIDYESG